MRRTSALALALATSLAAFGCGDGGGGNGDQPDARTNPPGPDAMIGTAASLTIAPTAPDFGSVVVGDTSAASTFTVTNAGDNASTALTVAVGGTNAGDFIVTNDTCNGNTLAGSATCTIDVTFTAGASGARAATLSATAATGGSATANLRGTGADPAALSIAPTPHDFGGAVVNATSSNFTFTVTNLGDQDSGNITANLAGGDAAHFAIVTNDCDGQVLAANATCDIVAHFLPTSSGSKTTTISVTSSPGGTVTSTLTGNGLVDATLEITPIVKDFGSVTQGGTSANVTLIIKNNGDVDTGTLTASLAGTDMADFTISANTCANAVLAAGGTCTAVVAFAPQSPGNKTASFDVSGTPGGTASSTFVAVGLAPGNISISPTPHDFGSITVGSQGLQQVFTVTNNGGSPTGTLGTALNGTDPADFPIVAGSDGCQGRVLPAGATCTIAIVFSPIAAGNRTASLSVTGVPGGTAPAALSGIGLSPAVLNVAPPAWDFGSVGTDVTSAVKSFTVTNLGDTTSGTLTREILGTNFSHFAITGGTCTVNTTILASGQSCTVDVVFDPSTTGDKVATLEVFATPGGTHTSLLNGNGITPGDITSDVSSLSFGNGIIDADSVTPQVITFTNDGQAPTGTLATSITGDYNIVTDSCVGQILNATESCTVSVRFSPRGVGGPVGAPATRAGTLTVNATPGTPTSGVGVALNGGAVEKITLTPGPTYTFAATQFTEVRPKTFTVMNNTANFGNRARTFTQTATNTGGEWSITNNNCPSSTGTALAAGGTCTMDVEFAPKTSAGAPGTRTSNLTVTGTGGTDVGTDSTSLSADATGPLTIVEGCGGGGLARTSGAFGDTVVGEERVSCFRVTNNANPSLANADTGALSTSFTARGDFAITFDRCAGVNLAAAGSCNIDVMFFPQTPGTADFDLKVRSTASYEANGTFSANGLAPGKLEITANSSNDFGKVISTNSASRTFTITNTGDQTVNNVATTLGCNTATGTNACGDFSEAGLLACSGTATAGDPADLRGGESCTMTIDYDPQVVTVPDAYTESLEAAGTPATMDGTTFSTVFDSMPLKAEALSQLTIAPGATGTYAFGNQLSGTPSTPVTFTVTNNGAAAVSGATVASSNSLFAVPGATNFCSNIAAGSTCTFQVIYTPNPDSITATGPALDTSNLTVAAGAQPGAQAATQLTGQPVLYARLKFDDEHIASGGYDALFGGTTTGTEGATRTFTLRNVGGSSTTAISSTLTINDTHWTVVDNCMGQILDPNGICTYVVKFTPVAPTTGTLDLQIKANTSNTNPQWDRSAFRTVQGEATVTNGFTISPAFHDFGDVLEDLGTSGPTFGFTVTNNSGTTRSPSPSVSQSRDGGSANTTNGFSISGCTGSLTPATSCTLTVRFNPTTNRDNFYGDVIIGGGDAVAHVTGHSDRKPYLRYNDGGLRTSVSLDFTGNTGIGSVRTMTAKLKNYGDRTTGAISVTKDGATPSAYTLSGCVGTTLAPNAECTITATFAPLGAGVMTAAGHYAATPGSAGSPLDLDLSGTGASQAALGISPTAVQDCGDAVPAERDVTCTTVYTISNNTAAVSTGRLTFAVADANFHAVDGNGTTTCKNGVTLGAASTCTITVHYKPTAAGNHSGTLSVSGNPGGTVTAPLTGDAVSALTASPTSHDFGCRDVDVGDPPDAASVQMFTFTNESGTPALSKVLTVNLGGTNPDSFAIYDDHCTGKKLVAGDNCTVYVKFVPLTVTNNLSATLDVSAGSLNKTAGSVTLVGDGLNGTCNP